MDIVEMEVLECGKEKAKELWKGKVTEEERYRRREEGKKNEQM